MIHAHVPLAHPGVKAGEVHRRQDEQALVVDRSGAFGSRSTGLTEMLQHVEHRDDVGAGRGASSSASIAPRRSSTLYRVRPSSTARLRGLDAARVPPARLGHAEERPTFAPTSSSVFPRTGRPPIAAANHPIFSRRAGLFREVHVVDDLRVVVEHLLRRRRPASPRESRGRRHGRRRREPSAIARARHLLDRRPAGSIGRIDEHLLVPPHNAARVVRPPGPRTHHRRASPRGARLATAAPARPRPANCCHGVVAAALGDVPHHRPTEIDEDSLASGSGSAPRPPSPPR